MAIGSWSTPRLLRAFVGCCVHIFNRGSKRGWAGIQGKALSPFAINSNETYNRLDLVQYVGRWSQLIDICYLLHIKSEIRMRLKIVEIQTSTWTKSVGAEKHGRVRKRPCGRGFGGRLWPPWVSKGRALGGGPGVRIPEDVAFLVKTCFQISLHEILTPTSPPHMEFFFPTDQH